MIEETILTKKRFSTLIQETVRKKRLDYMDAILAICEERGLDPADVGKLISPVIKEKLEAECIRANLIKSETGVLPI